MRGGSFDSLEGKVGRETPTDEIRDGSGERIEGMQNDNKEKTANNGVSLRNLSTLFKIVKNWVLGELKKKANCEIRMTTGGWLLTYLLVKLVDHVRSLV